MTLEEAGLITTTRAAELLEARGFAVKPDTVKHYIARGLLKAERMGSKSRGYWLIKREDLDAFTPPKGGRPRTAPRGREEGEDGTQGQ